MVIHFVPLQGCQGADIGGLYVPQSNEEGAIPSVFFLDA